MALGPLFPYIQVKKGTDEARELFLTSCVAFQTDCSLETVSKQREAIQSDTALLLCATLDVHAEIEAIATARAAKASAIEQRDAETERRKASIQGNETSSRRVPSACVSNVSHSSSRILLTARRSAHHPAMLLVKALHLLAVRAGWWAFLRANHSLLPPPARPSPAQTLARR